MNKHIILTKARLNLIYITSEHIFMDIKNCEEKFELEDFMELYEIIREWSYLMQLKIHGFEIDKKTFPDTEDSIQPKLEKAINAFCFLGDDCILRMADIMNENEEELVVTLFSWLMLPTFNVKNLLLMMGLLLIFGDKIDNKCLALQDFMPLIKEAITIVRIATGTTEDLSF